MPFALAIAKKVLLKAVEYLAPVIAQKVYEHISSKKKKPNEESCAHSGQDKGGG